MPYPIKIIGNLIGICWLAFLVYWVANFWGNKKSIYKKQRPWLHLMFVLLGIVIAGTAAKYYYQTPIIPYNKVTQTLGVAVCAFGIGWAIWARRVLGANWSSHPTVKENHELISAGPYAVTRHPIYSGIITVFLGTFLAAIPTWAGLVFSVFMIIGFSFKLRKEEQLMMQAFPEQYLAYKQRVRATLIPYIL